MLIYNLMIEKNIQLQWFSLIASGIFPAETTEAHSFIARLGQIFDMRSDNGTNLIGAETNHWEVESCSDQWRPPSEKDQVDLSSPSWLTSWRNMGKVHQFCVKRPEFYVECLEP